MRKKWDFIGDIIVGIGGIALLVFLKTSYPVFFILGAFLVVIGTIGLFLDIKIVEGQRETPRWWQSNLPIVLGILLLNSGTIFVTNSTGRFPSDTFHIVLTSIGAALWILAFGYDIWRKYQIYLKQNHDNRTN